MPRKNQEKAKKSLGETRPQGDLDSVSFPDLPPDSLKILPQKKRKEKKKQKTKQKNTKKPHCELLKNTQKNLIANFYTKKRKKTTRGQPWPIIAIRKVTMGANGSTTGI